MNTHDLFSLSLYRLTVVSAGILAILFLTGCPDADFGEWDSCRCTDDFVLNLVPYGMPVSPIKKESPPLLIGYPGQIIEIEVSGGDDFDFVINTAVDPLDGCGGGCPPSQECMDKYGNSSQVCLTAISNRNLPYIWNVPTDGEGYVQSYEIDMDTATGLHDKVYIELKKEYIDTIKEFTVSVGRIGASQEEFQGDNLADVEWKGVVLPPPQFTLSSIRHPQTTHLPLSGPAQEGSARLREDKSQNSDVDQSSLKQRKNDPSDNSVPIDYRVVHEEPDNTLPINFDDTNPDHTDKIIELRSRGIDILVVNHIYNQGHPAPPVGQVNSGIHGCTYPAIDFILLSSVECTDVKLVLMHEIGHCCGLADNEPLVDYNIMLSGIGAALLYQGMDVHSNFSQNIKFKNGFSIWDD